MGNEGDAEEEEVDSEEEDSNYADGGLKRKRNPETRELNWRRRTKS
jgi:hypothetical protein